ncbi:MAG: hypothetical protein HKN81_12035 [Gammaproteobacteria bacterium]|nr:hypothetical protein [Gammaproteobacteria bacterium]
MNKTGFEHPRDSYPDVVREYYAGINGADAALPPRETEGDTWHCRSQVSRGDVLEKAGYSMLHITEGRIYDSPGSIKFFETLAYPANPRAPGFVFLANLNQTEKAGRSIVLYTDIFFQDGEPNDGAKALFARHLQPIYEAHGRDFAARYKGEAGRILAGIGGETGVMDFMQEADADPFIDEIITAALSAYREVLDTTVGLEPSEAQYDAMYRHRARLVEWLTMEDIGIRFAVESGVPLALIESYGYPPVVRY